MLKKPYSPTPAARLKTAKNGHSAKNGTALANYSYTTSCERLCSTHCLSQSWGGARNSAFRASDTLNAKQVKALIDAARYAEKIGRIFQRHWTIHYGKAGIDAAGGSRFVSRLLDMVSKQTRREGGQLTALWVRERASDKGEHVHILLHLPTAMRLQGRTRRWIVAAGGTWAPGISKVRIIGGRLSKIGENRNEHLRANAGNVVRYVLKAASDETAIRHKLPLSGKGGRIIGKRCGWTQNIGNAARDKSCP